jgi:hypothetical protein
MKSNKVFTKELHNLGEYLSLPHKELLNLGDHLSLPPVLMLIGVFFLLFIFIFIFSWSVFLSSCPMNCQFSIDNFDFVCFVVGSISLVSGSL